MMDINLNGAPHRTTAVRLADLLAEQAIDPAARGVAVAINAAIVPRAQWPATALAAGDMVEIVRPHSGG
jgi:sulfur carrier protein